VIIDCHAHYDTRVIDAAGLIEMMEKAGVRRTALIPHPIDPPETKKSGALMAVQRTMFYYNSLRPFGAAITKSMYTKDGEWNMWYRKFMPGGAQRFSIGKTPDNGGVAEAVSRYPDRLLGWIFLNPENEDALDELERWRVVPGMIGVKLHPFVHRFPMQKAALVAKRAEELGLPLLVHLGFGPCGDYNWLIERFPGLKVIFAHLGVPFYKAMWPLIARSPNAYMDISSVHHVSEGLVRKAVKAVGPSKCLFGSDSVYTGDEIMAIRGWVEGLDISEVEKEMIFSTNFLGLI